MAADAPSGHQAWESFAEGLRTAGDRLGAELAGLDPMEQADGYRALLRALTNQLGRFEVDRERPELVAFNGWREKMLMDNPDFRYWVAEVRDDRRYRVSGSMGDAAYQSLTVYDTSGSLGSGASARIDSDDLDIDLDGHFEVTLSPEPPSSGDWLRLPEGASTLWVRQFHQDVGHERHGWCRIDALDPPADAPAFDPARFERHLRRLGATTAGLPDIFTTALGVDLEHPNEVRHWSEMTGGAAYTEPDVHYLRGAWQLAPDEALVLEGEAVPCRWWSVLLYSRFLNSLDHRYRSVSRTGGTARIVDDRYRLVIAGRDPGDVGDWLDTEGRPFGLFVFRFLHPEHPPELPTLRRCRLDEMERW
jgi:hypothetical protein